MGDLHLRWRRRAALVAIAVAALAAAGTSPSPTPPPDITGSATGVIELTPDRPAVALDITVRGNEAIPDGAHTVLGIRADAPWIPPGPPDSESPGSPVVARLLGMDAVDAGVWTTNLGATPIVSDCDGGGPCEQTFTLVALLTDPTRGPQELSWTATAETRVPTGGPAAAGGRLVVEAAQPVEVAAGELPGAAAIGDRIALSHDAPRTIRTVTVRLPDAPDQTATAPAAVHLRVRAMARDDEQEPPARVRLYTGDGFLQADPFGRGSDPFNPFGDCLPGEPCERVFQVVFDWAGGRVDREVDVDWDIAAWAPLGEHEAGADPVEIVIEDTPDGLDGERLTAEASGTLEFTDGLRGNNARLRVTFDDPVQQAFGEPPRLMSAVLEARVVRADADLGDVEIAGSIHDGPWQFQVNGSGPAAAREPLIIGSPLDEPSCLGQRQCTFEVGVYVGLNGIEPVEATVEWRLGLVAHAAPERPFPRDAALRLELVPGE